MIFSLKFTACPKPRSDTRGAFAIQSILQSFWTLPATLLGGIPLKSIGILYSDSEFMDLTPIHFFSLPPGLQLYYS
eukprot:COSAG02_NODE_1884_length_10516_cov_4.173466_3_plen_76_part_00